MTSAPVIKFLERHPDERKTFTSLQTKDQHQIFSIIKSSSVVAECVKLSDVYGDTAIKSLDVFPQTEAKNALINIVNATVNS